MSLFLYYAFHSVVNQIRKLFKTWVAILILICFALGLGLGLLGAFIGSLADDLDDIADDISGETEPGEDPAAVPGSDEEPGADDEPGSDEEPEEEDAPVIITDSVTGETVLELAPATVAEIVIFALSLFMILLGVMTADKSNIFLPGDTVLLFTAPMTPQKVLIFRLCCQMGLSLFLTVYMLIELPILTDGTGFGVWSILALLISWGLIVAQSMLIKSAAFIYCAGDEKRSRTVRIIGYGALGLLVAGFLAFSAASGVNGMLGNALLYLSWKPLRYIPVFGWSRAIPAYAMEGNLPMSLLFLFLTLCLCVGVFFVLSRMKADYYEAASAKADEYAKLLAAAQESRTGIAVSGRKKDRSEKLRRNEFNHGSGANVFFFKEMYNRFRFAPLGIFTKTFITYAVLSVGLTAVLCLRGVRMLLPGAAVIAAISFYRTLGNPLEHDTSLPYFSMIPAKATQKLFWSLFAGLANTALDAILPLIVCAVIAGAGVAETAVWFLLILSMDLYASCVSAFLNLSLPNNAGKTVKQVVQILFLYFGLIPAVIAVVIGAVMGSAMVGGLIAAAIQIALGSVFFFLLPLFL